MKENNRKHSGNKRSEVKGNLQQYGTHAYKKFGQNFLLDLNYIDFMISGLDLQDGDFVLEIGPGMGALTEQLINNSDKKITYLGVEVDLEKIVFLKSKFPDLDITNQSILEFNLEEYLELKGVSSYKVIGSLPFNISKMIIQKFSEYPVRPSRAVFMVQKEVGEDYAGERYTTFLSVYLSQFWKVESTQVVPAEAFFPVPDVDGLSLVLSSIENKRDEKFIKFVKHGFLAPRKKLGNTQHLERDDRFYDLRPHELSSEQWMELFEKNNSKAE